ncbi:MAG: aspartate kinase [Candidatus Obscuribacterales bacterium]|nr:aspartate kinase [Candidatus Obscuribacterales bacterium]
MSEIKVVKFGGSSVKNPARIQHVAGIIANLAKSGPVIAVASAMGDTTDYLVKLSNQCSDNPDKRELDSLLSTGEQISISLLAMALRQLGVKAKSLTGSQVGIFTETVHTKARIIDLKTDNLLKHLESVDVIIVAGFQGVTADGDITTLGRGGSDTTAVALAAAIKAEACDIYTDVDGIYTCDPNKVRQAKLLQKISYGEVLEMARLGAQVLHPRSVELARQYKIKLRVRNTFKPEHEGTMIEGSEDMEIFRNISGVVMDEDQASVAIMDFLDKPGVAGTITKALADNNIAIDMIMQSFHPTVGHNSITFTVHDSDLKQTIEILNGLKEEMGAKEVAADPDCAKVSLIGAGLSGQPSIAALLFSTLGKNGINIKMIATSEMKITCVVRKNEVKKAATLIHSAFELDKEPQILA